MNLLDSDSESSVSDSESDSEYDSDSSFEMGFISLSSFFSESFSSTSGEDSLLSSSENTSLTSESVQEKNKDPFETSTFFEIKSLNLDLDSLSKKVTEKEVTNQEIGFSNRNTNEEHSLSGLNIKDVLIKNCQINSNSGSKTCTVCGELFTSQIALDVHKLDHFTLELYSCELCSYVSKNKEDYVLHVQTHDQTNALRMRKIPTKSFVCDICGKWFKFISSYKRHISMHTSIFTCNICNATFTSQLLCHQHKLKHAKKKMNKCEVCGKVFERPYQLSLHMQVHKGSEQKYSCLECDITYNYKTSLMRHRSKYHAPNSSKFQCNVCGELFKTKKMLNCHTILHTTNKLIQCTECPMTFKYRSSYHRHFVIHRSSKPFRCLYCGKTFQTENLLQTHKSLHAANDKFVCKICDKSFAYESFLKDHLILHEEKSCGRQKN